MEREAQSLRPTWIASEIAELVRGAGHGPHGRTGTEELPVGIGEMLLIGLAMSADAFSVTVSNIFAYGNERKCRLLLMPLMFGLAQGIMPLIGYGLGGLAAELIDRYAGIVSLIILAIIGGNMLIEGARDLRGGEKDDTSEENSRLTLGLLFFQSIATAIDAFAIGVSLRAMGAPILVTSIIICCTTAACCIVALFIGRKLGSLLGEWAEVVGGLVLIGIGVHAFLS